MSIYLSGEFARKYRETLRFTEEKNGKELTPTQNKDNNRLNRVAEAGQGGSDPKKSTAKDNVAILQISKTRGKESKEGKL